MKRKAFVIAMVLLAIFNISALSTLTYNRWLRPEGPPRDLPDARLFDRFGLDEEQMTRVAESRNAFFQRTEPLAIEMHNMRKEIFGQLLSDMPDTAEIFRLTDSVSSLQNTIEREVIVSILSEGFILTPEQKRRMLGMFERHMGNSWQDQRRFGRMFKGGGGMGPFDGPPDEMGEGWRPMDSSRRPGWRNRFRTNDSMGNNTRGNVIDSNNNSSTTGRR